jgi:transposase
MSQGDIMSTTSYDITDEQWERIKDMFPPERTGKPGRPCGTSNRDVLNGGLWIGHTQAQWKELPSRYGKKSTIHERFKSWKDNGILEAIFIKLSKDCDMQDLSFDSTFCKVHQHAVGAKRGPKNQD